eukprot:1387706-Rhodomonas_salina.1
MPSHIPSPAADSLETPLTDFPAQSLPPPLSLPPSRCPPPSLSPFLNLSKCLLSHSFCRTAVASVSGCFLLVWCVAVVLSRYLLSHAEPRLPPMHFLRRASSRWAKSVLRRGGRRVDKGVPAQYLEDKVVQLTRKQDALGQQIKASSSQAHLWIELEELEERFRACASRYWSGYVKERKIERIAKEKMT